MRYDDPRLIEALAREYVLGTLRGRARARFARVLTASLTARRAVLAWERSLQPLALAVPAAAPPAHVWPRIASAAGTRDYRPMPVWFWQAFAASLALIAVAFGWLFFSGGISDRFPEYMAVVAEQDTPIWLLQGYERERELSVVTINERPEPAGNSYELWMLRDGVAPVSLGLIPGVGNAVLPLSAAQLAVLSQTMTLAVSLEPAGGSPTGLPTGPVIFTAPLLGV